MHIILISLVLAQAIDAVPDDIDDIDDIDVASLVTAPLVTSPEAATEVDPVQAMLALSELLRERLPDAVEAVQADAEAEAEAEADMDLGHVDYGPLEPTTDSGIPTSDDATTTTIE